MLTDEEREAIASCEYSVADLLDIIDRLQQPAVVLAEAERLLREAGLRLVEFTPDGEQTIIGHWGCAKSRGATLAEAYAALKGGEHG